jgi:hydrogenase maturation protease
VTGDDRPRTATVLGIGSVLMGDDAAGPWVVELLEAHWDFPSGVTLLDAGTPGPELNHMLLGTDAVIVVDTVKAADPPGTVKIYRRDQLLHAPASPRLTPHQPGLREALLTGEFAEQGPREAVLVGIVPVEVQLGTALSAAVRDALPRAEAAVVEELTALGLAPTRRTDAAEPRPWWVEGGEL